MTKQAGTKSIDAGAGRSGLSQDLSGGRGEVGVGMGEVVSGKDVIAEVFLSPRVVDEGALGEFSASLRALIEQAASTSESVRSTAAEAEAIGAKLGESARAQQSRLELSGKLLAAIDQRAKDAQAMMEKAAGLEAVAASLSADTEGLADEHAKRVRARLEDELKAVESRAGAVKAGWAANAANVRAHLDEALKQGEARVAAAAASAREQAGEIERNLSAALRAGRESGEGIIAELARAGEEAREGIERAADEALGRLDASQERIIAALDDRLARLEALCARADTALGAAEDGEGEGGGRGSIGGMLRRLDGAREAAEFSVRQFDSLLGQADQCRSELGEWLAGSAELMDSVSARKADLERSLHHALGLCHAADTTLRARAGEVRQLLDARLHEVKTEASDAVTMLRAAAQRCEQLRAESETALHRNAEALERLGRLSAQLEPWQGVLAKLKGGIANADGEVEDLPEPLARTVRAAQAAVRADLERIAAALAEIAGERH